MRTAVAAVTASRSQPDAPEEDASGFLPVPGPPERPVLGDPERLALERLRPASLRTSSSFGDPALHSRLLFSLIPAHLPNTRPKSSTGKSTIYRSWMKLARKYRPLAQK